MNNNRRIRERGNGINIYDKIRDNIMYLTIIILPLLSGIINGIIGRKIGKGGSEWIIKGSITGSTILGIIGYYEIVIRNTGVIIEITKMIETENIEIT